MSKIFVSFVAVAISFVEAMFLSVQEKIPELPINSSEAIIVWAANAGTLLPYFHLTRIPPV